VQFESFFQLDTSTRTRGHSVKLKKKSFHTELRQHFFSERVINPWNSLDEETVTASSLNSFKNNLIRQRKHMKIGHVLGKWYASGPTRPSQLPLVNLIRGELSFARIWYATVINSLCSGCAGETTREWLAPPSSSLSSLSCLSAFSFWIFIIRSRRSSNFFVCRCNCLFVFSDFFNSRRVALSCCLNAVTSSDLDKQVCKKVLPTFMVK